MFRIDDEDDSSQKVTYEDATLNECTEITGRALSAFATVVLCVPVCVDDLMVPFNEPSNRRSGLMFTQS